MDLRKEIEKILKDNLAIYGRPEHRGIKDEATDQLLALFDKHTKSAIEDILVFLDELEMEQPQDLKTDNWRNWKYIRNSIVDKYQLSPRGKEKV